MQTLTNYIQSWLSESENPLVELYRYLRMFSHHSFLEDICFFRIDYYCQSLRLHILSEQVTERKKTRMIILSFTFQATRIRNRSAKQKHLYLSNYIPCKSFNIEYWKEYNFNNQQRKTIINEKPRGRRFDLLYLMELNFEILDIGMTIVCDDEGKFQIIHWPPLPIGDSIAILQILEVRRGIF